MAEKKKEEEKKKSGLLKTLLGEKADRTATFGMLAVGAAYVAKELWSKISGKVAEKGVGIAEKKIEKIFGLDTESAEKTIKDEECFRRVLAQREDKDKIEAIRAELKQIDPEKCSALILYVARLLKESSYKEREREKYDFTTVNSFLDSLLVRQDTAERLSFLDEENVFSLISKKKTSPTAEWLKDFAKDAPEKIGVFAKEAAETIDSGAKKLAGEIEKAIYACDADDNILLDPKTRKGILKQITYKGFKETALPGNKKRTWALVIFAAIVIIMMICGFIWS